jgi:hypothetical protein
MITSTLLARSYSRSSVDSIDTMLSAFVHLHASPELSGSRLGARSGSAERPASAKDACQASRDEARPAMRAA